MKKVHLDFETRSTVDIWKSGGWIYSAHPTTRIQCVAFAVDDEEVVLNDWFRLRRLAQDPEVLFCAYNAYFERVVWKNILVKKYGFPPVPLTRWRDVMAKSCAYGLPKKMEKAANALGIKHRKDKAGEQIMKRMAKPISKKDGTVYFDEDHEHYKILGEYCMQDVRVERELDNKLPDLSPKEQEIWFYDQLINERGVRVDRESVEKIIKVIKVRTSELNKELTELTNGRVTKGTQVKSMVEFLNDNGCDIPDLRKQTVTEYIENGKLKPEHIKVLRLRQQLSKSSLAKYNRLLLSIDDDGVLRDSYFYHGAGPGRWSGKLVQLQNLPYDKKGVFDPESVLNDIGSLDYQSLKKTYPGSLMRAISSALRGVFVPNPGKELYVVDYGAIEARVLMWMAGETKGLSEFIKSDRGEDEDIYVKMAQRIFGDPSLTKKENSKERFLGKTTILGCGYGMGGNKFSSVCQGYGLNIKPEEGSRIVNLYRTTYSSIKNFWYGTERAATKAFTYPGKICKEGNVHWVYRKERNAIFCRLPSGRILTYLDPKIVPNRFDGESMSFMTEVNSQWVRKEVFGGLLVENVVQGTARDIMAYSFPRLEKAGFPVLMHTHDEIVSEQEKGAGRIDEMIKLMCQEEEWSKGCPIVAEGFTCDRYKKG